MSNSASNPPRGQPQEPPLPKPPPQKPSHNPPNQPYGYYYGNEADQYTFYRLPKALFTNPRYKSLSDGAKILYGLMLDRMGLSIKNSWLDDRNRVYIIFTLENVQEFMNCKHDKAIKILAELDTDKGVGLIERVKQGQGKPAIIYVRKFFDNADPAEVLTSEKPKSALPHSPKPRVRKNRSQDLGKTECNKNDISNNEFNDIDFNDTNSIPSRTSPASLQHENVDNLERNGKGVNNKAFGGHLDNEKSCSQPQNKTQSQNQNQHQLQSPPQPHSQPQNPERSGAEAQKNIDRADNKIPRNQSQIKSNEPSAKPTNIDKFTIYRQIIHENIEYNHLIQQHKFARERINEIVDLMLETICTSKKTIHIASDEYPAELVKSKFLKLNHCHIEFVLDCMKNNTTEIRNIKKYLLAVLFNAPSTMGSYYTSLVSHDMAGGKFYGG